MDCVCDLDPVHLVLRITVTATVVTDEGLTDLYRSLRRFASRGGPYAGILDLSGAVGPRLSSGVIRALAASDPAFPDGRPRVIVAAEPAMYGLARMFELRRDSMGGQLHVVRSLDEAYNLLGARPEDFSQRLSIEDLAA